MEAGKVTPISEINPKDINQDNSANNVSLQQYRTFYKAVCCGDWKATNDFLKEHPEGVTARIDDEGCTPLMVAAEFGHLHIVEEFVKLMSEQDLELKDYSGRTVLLRAVGTGIIEIIECIIKKNENLIKIPNIYGLLPVALSVCNDQLDVARYLYSVTPLEEFLPERGYYGAVLLNQSAMSTHLDLALDLLKRCPSLALTPDQFGGTLMWILANKQSLFSSGYQLLFWQRWIYNWIQIEPASAAKDIHVNITTSNASDDKINKKPGVEKIYQSKSTHILSLELLRLTCDQIATLDMDSQWKVINSLFKAAEKGIPEFIIGVINANPSLLKKVDSLRRNFFFFAVRFRQAKVFSLIYGLVTKIDIANLRDSNADMLLHMVGMLESSTQLNRISGAALQMQRELQWFEEVKLITPPGSWESTNAQGKTARELFTEHHKDLRKEGEEWMKQNATSCTVVAALIVTVMFAASFTVPGGNNQNTGYPMFQDHKLFKLFIISDAISLFSSSTSLLMFLGILTSRYAEDDFLKSLPTKLIIGLSMLFISMASMMITFSAAISVMLPGRLWISIPMILFASVPVSLFVWLQFPLLVEIYHSTYGMSIFDRNMKPWIGVTHKI